MEGGPKPGKVVRREREETPQELEVMKRYIDLRRDAYNALMSEEERKDFAQNLIDLVKVLNKGEGISSGFREDLLRLIQTIERNHLHIIKAVDVARQLDRQSRVGIQAPHLYEEAVTSIKAALQGGIPVGSLEPVEAMIREYLRRTQEPPKRRIVVIKR